MRTLQQLYEAFEATRRQVNDALLDLRPVGEAWEADPDNFDKRVAYAQRLIVAASFQQNLLNCADSWIRQAERERPPDVIAEVIAGQAQARMWLDEIQSTFTAVTGRPWQDPPGS